MKREYRGQRSVTAIADFIRQQQVNPVKEMPSIEEVNTIDVSAKSTHSVNSLRILYIIVGKYQGALLKTCPTL